MALIVLLVEGNRKPLEDSNSTSSEAFLIESSSSSKYMTKKIGNAVYKNAEQYLNENTIYKQTGKGIIKDITYIDCSGLVIACYKKALEGTKYTLPFTDASSQSLYTSYVTPTTKPNKGDVIFMSYIDDCTVSHVGIVGEIKGDIVYFIDATPNEENKSGKAVNIRHYKTDDEKIIGYGIMKLVKVE